MHPYFEHLLVCVSTFENSNLSPKVFIKAERSGAVHALADRRSATNFRRSRFADQRHLTSQQGPTYIFKCSTCIKMPLNTIICDFRQFKNFRFLAIFSRKKPPIVMEVSNRDLGVFYFSPKKISFSPIIKD